MDILSSTCQEILKKNRFKMKLHSSYRFVDEKTRDSFYKLEKGDDSERELFKLLKQALTNIEENAFSGVQVPKKLMPKKYIEKYEIKNLWKYNLPKGWRLLYSIMSDEIIVISLILEWCDHNEYERRFKY